MENSSVSSQMLCRAFETIPSIFGMVLCVLLEFIELLGNIWITRLLVLDFYLIRVEWKYFDG